jgi:hypothetical protein
MFTQTNHDVNMQLCTKEVLEKAFGTISDDVYACIMETVHNECQQIIDLKGTIDSPSFIYALSIILNFYKEQEFKGQALDGHIWRGGAVIKAPYFVSF